MAKESNDPMKVRLKMVRLSYPNLFKARGFGKAGEGEKKFSASAIIDPETKSGRTNIKLLEAAIEAAKEAKWGSKVPKIKKDKICLKEGDDDADETAGMMILSASNTKKPLALDENGDDVTEADDVLYGGCYVDMIVRIWAMDNEYGIRINASLEGVKFRDDGEAFSAHSKTTADDFDDDDDEDDRPKSKKRRSRDDDDDDDEDEKPKSRRRSSRDDDDEDEDEKPRSRRRSSRDDDDEDEDEKPRSRRRSSRDDDDDEDEKPKKRRSRDDDDEDEDEKPKKRRSRDDDDEDEDDKPRSRKKPAADKDKSERRRRSRDDDDDY